MESQIVVGVDGSELAEAALRWAVAEAARRGVGVLAVAVSPLDPAAVAAQVERAAAHRPDVPVEHVVRAGSAVDALLESADGAAMLVLGGHSAARALPALLGSVAAYCVRHARVPVVLVPDALAPLPTASARTALTPGPLL